MKVLIEKCKECGKREDGNWADSEAKKLERHQLCFNCNFWREKVWIKDRLGIARIDGSHYTIGKEEKSHPSEFRGFGGSKFVIVFNDGRRVKTTNLWHQGSIPEHFKERLPDNAKFEPSVKWKTSPRGDEYLG